MNPAGLPAEFHEAAAEIYDRARGGTATPIRPGTDSAPGSALDAIMSALM